MPKMIGINIGFVTNSSSVVHHFPASLMNDPQLKVFIEAMEIQNGFVGRDLWNRGGCASFAVTKEQKREIQNEFIHNEYDAVGPIIDVEGDVVVVVYGDEYSSIASTLCAMFREATARAGLPELSEQDYN